MKMPGAFLWLINQTGATDMRLLEIYDFLHRFTSVILTEIPCAVYDTLGVYCPGCGGRRAIKALFSGKRYCRFGITR